MRSLFAVLLLLVACRTAPLDFDGGVPGAVVDLATSPSGARDLAAAPDLHATPTSCCSTAGNPGNELGVGKFCNSAADCKGKQANICSTAFAANLNFCTMSCMPNGGDTQCGSGATCQCAGTQCACVPGECITPPPGC